MNNELIEYLHSVYPELPIDLGYMRGYSDEEIAKIERLYDIQVKGQLYDFLKTMGRCSGGLFGDDPLVFYRNGQTVRGNILYQDALRDELPSIQQYNMRKQKALFISVESYTQYFFLLTESEDTNKVYLYDENEETIEPTDWDFKNYLRHIVNVYTRNYKIKAPFNESGELIII